MKQLHQGLPLKQRPPPFGAFLTKNDRSVLGRSEADRQTNGEKNQWPELFPTHS